MPEGRIPPQALDIEMVVLGAMMIDGSRVHIAFEILNENDFYKPGNGKVFRAMQKLFESNSPIDSITVCDAISKAGSLDIVGGPVYLGECTSRASSAANLEHYCKVVLEKSLRRQMISASSAFSSESFDDTEEILDVIDRAQDKVLSIGGKISPRPPLQAGIAITQTVDRLQEMAKSGEQIVGTSTGFGDLDNLINGLEPANFYCLAARPSIGKTSLALDIAINSALKGKRIGFFSLEMPQQQIALRAISSEARVNSYQLRRPKNLSTDDMRRISNIIGKGALFNNLTIDDASGLSLTMLRSKAKRLIAEHKIEGVVVDYLQLMTPNPKIENREQQISNITGGIKAMVKDYGIWVIILSQLNRNVESRKDRRPGLADLRESGAIEQDSDVVVFIHRPEFYGELKFDDGSTAEGMAEIIVAKNRNGPTGSLKLKYFKEWTRFENLAREDRVEPEMFRNDGPF